MAYAAAAVYGHPAFALDVIGRHPGEWEIGFQHDNTGAGHFWRAVATDAWGDDWVETEEAVPDKPDVPPDEVVPLIVRR